jgi:hypothetical protein
MDPGLGRVTLEQLLWRRAVSVRQKNDITEWLGVEADYPWCTPARLFKRYEDLALRPSKPLHDGENLLRFYVVLASRPLFPRYRDHRTIKGFSDMLLSALDPSWLFP